VGVEGAARSAPGVKKALTVQSPGERSMTTRPASAGDLTPLLIQLELAERAAKLAQASVAPVGEG